jgi:hypothetical protein
MMSRQVMFVISVDLETKDVFIDDDSLTARFGSHEQIWNTDKEEWEADDDDSSAYYEALQILNTKCVLGQE